MTPRRMHHRRIVVLGFALALMMSSSAAQTPTPTPGPTETPFPPTSTPLPGAPDEFSLTAVYRYTGITLTGTPGNATECQNPQIVASPGQPEIDRVELYHVPSNVSTASSYGHIVAVYTTVPFAEWSSGSEFAAITVRALTVNGQTEHRLYQVRNGESTSGASDNGNRIADGTSDLAAVSPDGAYLLFALPEETSQIAVRLFYGAGDGAATICDAVPDSGPASLPARWLAPSNLPSLVSITDAPDDVVQCGVGGSITSPEADITAVAVHPAPDTSPFPNGYLVEIQTAADPTAMIQSAASYTAYLNLTREGGLEENWLYSAVNGTFSSRVLAADNTPVNETSRWGDFTGTSMADPNLSNRFVFNIPGDVTAITARTALTVAQGDPQACDQAPGGGTRLPLPPVWVVSGDTPVVGSFDDPAGDVVEVDTGNSVAAPAIDLTTVDIIEASALGEPRTVRVKLGPPGDTIDRRVRLTYESDAGGIVISEVTETGAIVTTGDGFPVLTPNERPAYLDAATETAVFTISPNAANLTVETTANTAEGITARDIIPNTTVIVVPQAEPTLPELPFGVVLCPPLDRLPPRSALWTDINEAADNWDLARRRALYGDVDLGTPPETYIFDSSQRFLQLTDPNQPFHPYRNPLIFRDHCVDPIPVSESTPTPPPPARAPESAEISDPMNDLVLCQSPNPAEGTHPSDILRVTVGRIPGVSSATYGYVVGVYTATPFESLMDDAYSAAVSVRGVTASGTRANRLIEVHDGNLRLGATDDNGNLIGGTSNLVDYGADGAALVYLPETTMQIQVRTFYTDEAGQPTLCDDLETVDLRDLMESETLGDLLDRLGVYVCPPLDQVLDRSTPLSSQDAVVAAVRALTAGGYTPGLGNALRLANPNRPFHPLFNPLMLFDSCAGDV
ncbi:MAG: hypothetical protein IPM16_13075 [Chloroflexi bacterium]|nr:hypothetical protein [Chloroflexota bacterium]